MFPTLCFHRPSPPVTTRNSSRAARPPHTAAHGARAKEGTSHDQTRIHLLWQLRTTTRKSCSSFSPPSNLLKSIFFSLTWVKAAAGCGGRVVTTWGPSACPDSISALRKKNKNTEKGCPEPLDFFILPDKLCLGCQEPKAGESRERRKRCRGSQTMANETSSAQRIQRTKAPHATAAQSRNAPRQPR